jgi:hypothetical protein
MGQPCYNKCKIVENWTTLQVFSLVFLFITCWAIFHKMTSKFYKFFSMFTTLIVILVPFLHKTHVHVCFHAVCMLTKRIPFRSQQLIFALNSIIDIAFNNMQTTIRTQTHLSPDKFCSPWLLKLLYGIVIPFLDTCVFRVGSFTIGCKYSITITTFSSTSFFPFGSTSTIELQPCVMMGGG